MLTVSSLETVHDVNIGYEFAWLCRKESEPDKELALKAIAAIDGVPNKDYFETKGLLFWKIGMNKDAIVELIRGARYAYITYKRKDSKFFDSQRMFAKAIEIAMDIGETEIAKKLLKEAELLIPSFKDEYERVIMIKYGRIK